MNVEALENFIDTRIKIAQLSLELSNRKDNIKTFENAIKDLKSKSIEEQYIEPTTKALEEEKRRVKEVEKGLEKESKNSTKLKNSLKSII